MKIIFVYPPFTHKKFNENISVVDNEFGVYPPIGLAYAAAVLRKEQANVKIIDANALNLSKEKTLDIIKNEKPKILGFDLHSAYVFYDTLTWISYLKKNLPKNIIILVSGFNFNLYPNEVMSHKEIDFGYFGSLANSGKKIIGFFNGDVNAKNVSGLVYRKNGKVHINSNIEYCNLDILPFPARDLLPNEKYYSFISKRKNFTVMLSQTGCPYRCNYCAIAKVPYLQRSYDNVFDEIKECYDKYKIREIDFFDGTFTVNNQFVINLCKRIIESKIDINWSCRTRIDCVNENLLKLMSESGCMRIYYGIESANTKILTQIKKGLDLSKVPSIIKLTRKYRIEPLGFFMIGNLGDTIETIEKNTEYAKKLDLEYVQFSRTIAKPKTDLDNSLIKLNKKDYWSEYIKGEKSEKRFENPWCSIPEKDIERLTKEAYISFYFRPKYIFKRLIKIKSFHELKRYLIAGLKIAISKNTPEDAK